MKHCATEDLACDQSDHPAHQVGRHRDVAVEGLPEAAVPEVRRGVVKRAPVSSTTV
jgi:hypothetical protein